MRQRHREILWEFLQPVLVFLVVGTVLFGATGVWPPMVAVESESMEPNMQKGDLVVVAEVGRYAGDRAGPDGVLTTHEARNLPGDQRTFGREGDVVVFLPPERLGSPIIHRARFHVEAGENWYARANQEFVRGDSCAELPNCPAPHAGFITKGDNNAYYDQVQGIAPVVKQEWLVAEGQIRLPWLGWVRLTIAGRA